MPRGRLTLSDGDLMMRLGGDVGASVPDQAGRASHGAAKASPPSGDHPSRVFVISRSVGEWSDRSESPIGFVTDEATAKLLTARAQEEWRAGQVLCPTVEYPDVPWEEQTDEQVEATEAAFMAARERREAKLRSLLTVDPAAVSECEYDDPFYFFSAVPAIAMEAREGRNRETGSDGEAATARADRHRPNEGR